MDRIDIKALEADLNAVRDALRADVGPEDLAHLEKMIRWGRRCSQLGYATAWIAPNPISAGLMSTGTFVRWAMVAHHVLHRGYDKVPGVPERYTSKRFAQGRRRVLDWLDWIDPDAWCQEHNLLHHYKLGEVVDPDQPEQNFGHLRDSGLPMPARAAVVAFFSLTWKYLYYAPLTLKELHQRELQRQGEEVEPISLFDARIWSPFKEPGRRFWTESALPYVGARFVLMPLPFALLGPWAWLSVMANTALAEAMTNLHAFIVIVPNHGGEDLYRFDGPVRGRGEFYLRQIAGSVNYATGDDVTDFLHGWLNYQIEHHLWPDMTMLQYRKAQPQVKAICERHGVPYVQESVLTRARKLVEVAIGKTSMRRWGRSRAESAPFDGQASPSA